MSQCANAPMRQCANSIASLPHCPIASLISYSISNTLNVCIGPIGVTVSPTFLPSWA
jgi:hypothetical protein